MKVTACLVLLSLSGSLGCIGSYRFPERQLRSGAEGSARGPAPGNDPGPLAVKLAGPRRQEAFFRSRLEELGGRQTIAAEGPPPAGRFVSITVTEVPNSVAVQVWGMVALITAFIIPVYSEDSGYDLVFETFVDGRRQASYRYAVREKIFVWLGLLPAVWVNFLTRSRGDGFSDAIGKFVTDSRHDGF